MTFLFYNTKSSIVARLEMIKYIKDKYIHDTCVTNYYEKLSKRREQMNDSPKIDDPYSPNINEIISLVNSIESFDMMIDYFGNDIDNGIDLVGLDTESVLIYPKGNFII